MAASGLPDERPTADDDEVDSTNRRERVIGRSSTATSRHPIAPKQDQPERAGTETDEAEDDEEGGDDDDDDDEEEPKLKYARLTGSLGGLYRNGDATSAFLVAGDKMIVGTHNGNVHVLSLPSLQSIKFYHAHSASVTAISVSPFTVPVFSDDKYASLKVPSQPSQGSPVKPPVSSGSSPSGKQKPQQIVPPLPSNMIHIATSSIDGKVCIASLVDPKDVLLRDFARPVQAVALSPEYKSDRAYLSGGLAGRLMLTVGGRPGVSSKSVSGGSAALASGWLGSIGLGQGSEKDTVLHSGEGAISTIKWSPSGKHVVWINEQGIKIMRSNIKLEGVDAEYAWKRISHVDRPDGTGWEEMSGVWKGHAEWIQEDRLELHGHPWITLAEGESESKDTAATKATSVLTSPQKPDKKRKKTEKLVVGWGGTVWTIHVHPGGAGIGKQIGERTNASAEIVSILRVDCIISGLSLYTPNLLLVLAYIVPETLSNEKDPAGLRSGSSKGNKPSLSASPGTPKRGIQHRKNAVPPELRLIDLGTSEEVSADTLSVSRSESLSAADYHLGILPSQTGDLKKTTLPKGALEGLGDGIWTASMNATKMFSSAASMVGSSDGKSEVDSNSKHTTAKASSADASKVQQAINARTREAHPAMASQGMKIFIHSPYDCVLATTRELADHLDWLLGLKKYQEAWNLINDHPEVISPVSDTKRSSPDDSSMKKKSSSEDFFADDASASTISTKVALNSAAEKEKRRVGELWIQQLVDANDWTVAGEVVGKVLNTSPRWEHWAWEFIHAKRYQEILPFIPTTQLHPPLPSLVYEVFLGHYISRDRMKFRELLDRWPPELFDVTSIIAAIRDKIKSNEIREDTVEGDDPGRDWRILITSLAQLLLADNKPREALKYYIQLHDADAAMKLIGDFHLVDAVADDIPGLIQMRVTKSQARSASRHELEEVTSEAIRLLVDEAHHGVVRPRVVVDQLEASGNLLFLFFYLKALWLGPRADSSSITALRSNFNIKTSHSLLRDSDDSSASSQSLQLLEPFGDLAITLFAEYDRTLFMQFIKLAPTAYTFDHAYQLAESRRYIPELVHLLSSTGQTRRALFLIISSLSDVSLAISFCKSQADPSLWDDLLEYSMDKPRFIRGLLEEVGTAINPVELVRRIPLGLEIEGLREGLVGLVRELGVQESIAEGVARVWRGEVGEGMARLRGGGEKGVRVEVTGEIKKADGESRKGEQEQKKTKKKGPKPGHCVKCGEPFLPDETETIVAYPCGHTFHLSCLLPASHSATSSTSDSLSPPLSRAISPQPTNYTSFPPHTPHSSTFFSSLPPVETGVGGKITRAQIVREKLSRYRTRHPGDDGEVEGCPAPEHRMDSRECSFA